MQAVALNQRFQNSLTIHLGVPTQGKFGYSSKSNPSFIKIWPEMNIS